MQWVGGGGGGAGSGDCYWLLHHFHFNFTCPFHSLFVHFFLSSFLSLSSARYFHVAHTHTYTTIGTLVYDASGYYSGSIYAGNNIRRGSPQLCRELNAEMAISNFEAAPTSINGQHQSSHTLYDDIQEFMILSNFLPFPVHLVNAKYKTIVEGAPYATYIIHQTMCMPSSCTLDDLTQVMSYANLTHLRNNLIMRNTELVNVKILEESYEFYKDSAFYAFM